LRCLKTAEELSFKIGDGTTEYGGGYIEGRKGKELAVYFVTQMIAACFFKIVAAAEMEP